MQDRKTLLVLGSILVIALIAIVSFSCLDRQGDQKILQNQARLDSETQSEHAPQNAVVDDCTALPQTLENGRVAYPIAEKYSNLPFLGQIFTASNCDQRRVSRIQGVKDGYFDLGLKLWLKDTEDPDVKLNAKLEEMGFKCTQTTSTEGCYEWENDGRIKIEQLMELEPFVDKLKADDCRKCG